MRYISTRGTAPELGFEDVLLTGLARDGGLYVPKEWPVLESHEIASFAGQPYGEVATAVMRRFMEPEIAVSELRTIVEDAYATFTHEAVAPLVQIGPGDWLLELFHGPTLAFKDVAMQVLARLMDRTLAKRRRRATIVGATSGDTGGAAIEAFRGRDAIDIFILFPHGRVSDVQRRQMTTASEANVHAVAVEGTFDDCQAIVKGLFNDHAFRDETSLAGVNSINWARIMAQIVYYFTSAVALGSPERTVSFTVPTGNFGDIFAGYAALSMGLPIDRLVIATNSNDILARTLATGRYAKGQVAATVSPSMDIQVSSNFERLLFELADRNPDRIVDQMESLAAQGAFALAGDELAFLRQVFHAHASSEAETLATIADVQRRTGYLADPHTAVAMAAARKVARDPHVPMITLATAHPAKFPDAVARAMGATGSAGAKGATWRSAAEPPVVARQRGLPERVEILPNDQAKVAAFVRERARIGGRSGVHNGGTAA